MDGAVRDLSHPDPSHFGRFLAEATIQDPEPTRHLGQDGLFGLYLSWCRIGGHVPAPENDFHHAMKEYGINPSVSGLSMTGRAATDYILNSQPELP